MYGVQTHLRFEQHRCHCCRRLMVAMLQAALQHQLQAVHVLLLGLACVNA